MARRPLRAGEQVVVKPEFWCTCRVCRDSRAGRAVYVSYVSHRSYFINLFVPETGAEDRMVPAEAVRRVRRKPSRTGYL